MIIGFSGIIIISFLLGTIFISVLKGRIIQSTLFPGMLPFELSFQADGLSILMALIGFLLWSAVFVYSLSNIDKDIIRYHTLLLLLLGGVQGTLFAKDLISFYFFLEISAIVTYFLIIHEKNTPAFKAGYKYIIMTLVGAFLIFISILSVYNETKSFEIIGMIQCCHQIIPILFLTGCFVKAGAVPLHTWLPEAHPAAPSPVSAFLSGIMIKIGAYGIIRIALHSLNMNFEISSDGNTLNTMILFIGIISMLTGVILALMQTNVKRLLAYHSISQIGYILFGVGLGTKLGIAGGIFHMINHAFFKGLLFLCMGAVIFMTGEKNLNNLGGLWKKMPVTTITCLVAVLSISGIPPFSGFASKATLGKAADYISPLLKLILTMASILTFASFFKLMKYTFFGDNKNSRKDIKEAPVLMLVPMIILSIFCLSLGLKAKFILNRLIMFAIDITFQIPFTQKVPFWTLETLFNTLLIVVSGFTVFFLAVKFGLIGKEEKQFKGNNFRGKLTKCLNVNFIYDNTAILFSHYCNKMNNLHPRDLNTHLSWVVLTLIFIYTILIFEIL